MAARAGLKRGAGRSPALPSWADELAALLIPVEAEVIGAMEMGDWLPLATWAKAHPNKCGDAEQVGEILSELRYAIFEAAPDARPDDVDKLALAFLVACSTRGLYARACLAVRPEESGRIGLELELVAMRRGVKVSRARYVGEVDGVTTLAWGTDFLPTSSRSNVLTAKNDGRACWRGGV